MYITNFLCSILTISLLLITIKGNICGDCNFEGHWQGHYYWNAYSCECSVDVYFSPELKYNITYSYCTCPPYQLKNIGNMECEDDLILTQYIYRCPMNGTCYTKQGISRLQMRNATLQCAFDINRV